MMRQKVEKVKNISVGILIEIGYAAVLIVAAFLIGYILTH